MRRTAATALALLTALTGPAACSSSGSPAPRTSGFFSGGSGEPAASTDVPSQGTTPAPTASTIPALAGLCPDAGDTAALTACLSKDIGAFWSGQLHASISEPVVLDPVTADVPERCRPGLKIAPAFTCPGDGTLYFTAAFIAKIDSTYTGALTSYAYAVVLAHEMGHVVQLHVHQPQIEDDKPTDETTKFVEQQADCLSGVWAHAATRTAGLNPAQFRTVALKLLTSISTAHEIETHGTPEQRVAAIDRGLQGGTSKACSLAVPTKK